jgi:hypothetical protein
MTYTVNYFIFPYSTPLMVMVMVSRLDKQGGSGGGGPEEQEQVQREKKKGGKKKKT